MLDLFDNVWSDRDEIALDHVVDLTLQASPTHSYPSII